MCNMKRTGRQMVFGSYNINLPKKILEYTYSENAEEVMEFLVCYALEKITRSEIREYRKKRILARIESIKKGV